jgi:hypothetical protein
VAVDLLARRAVNNPTPMKPTIDNAQDEGSGTAMIH